MTAHDTITHRVRIKVRQDAARIDADDKPYTLAGPYEDVDLDRLSPRARALAEAIAGTTLSTAVDIWMETSLPIRDLVPDWEQWYTPERAARPDRRPWRGWSTYPADSAMDVHDYLEQQAAKIPPGWHVYGAHPGQPVPTQVYGMTVEQVVAYLKRQGRRINPSTWTGYVAREQAPQPATYVGRTPLWDPDEIVEWEKARPGPGARTDLNP